MPPRRYLNASEMAAALGMPAETLKSRRKSGRGLPPPDVQVGPGGVRSGTVYGWLPRRAEELRAHPKTADDPSLLPADLSAMPAGMLVGQRMWAALSGLSRYTVRDLHQASARRRRDGTPGSGDLPAPVAQHGHSPRWTVSQWREWEAKRMEER